MGNGKEKKQIKKLVQFFHIEDKVIFKESSKDVNSLLCAADVYISPSLFEGFGLSAAEAQFCSLPCVLSDSHPQEINISDSCVFLSTNDSAKLWAEQVLILQRNANIAQKCLNSNFLIDSTARFLCDFYYIHCNI
jgi:glycosyltransferase involved in cell wall biosynthesis